MITTFKADFETTLNLAKKIIVAHGETFEMNATLLDNGVPVDLEGYALELLYQDVDVLSAYYSIPASIEGTSTAKVVWGANNDIGARAYRCHLRAMKNGEISYPARWEIGMYNTPDFTASHLDPHVPVIDFDKYELINAPWTLLSDFNNHVDNLSVHVTQGEKNAWNALSNEFDNYYTIEQTDQQIADAIAAIPEPIYPVDSVNGKTGNVVLNASDVGALPDTYTAPVVSVNGKTGAVVLSASDVDAVAYEADTNNAKTAVTISEERKSGTTCGVYSFGQGRYPEASGNWSHAEGWETHALSSYTHAEGAITYAIGTGSHTEGRQTSAYGRGSHAEGRWTITSADYSHAEGIANYALSNSLHTIGFGTSKDDRKNAVETTIDGLTYLYGVGGYDGTNADEANDIAKVLSETARISDIPIAATDNPIMDGTASAGSLSNWARSDHVHPTDTSRASVAYATLNERGFSEWNVACSDPEIHGFVVYDGDERKYRLYDSDAQYFMFDETEAIWPEDTATSLQFRYEDADLTFVATRAELPGFVLGSQTDKPLAGITDIPAVVAPTSAAATGQAADAEATWSSLSSLDQSITDVRIQMALEDGAFALPQTVVEFYDGHTELLTLSETVTFETLSAALGPVETQVPASKVVKRITFGTDVTFVKIGPNYQYSTTSPVEFILVDDEQTVLAKQDYLFRVFYACESIEIPTSLRGFAFDLGGDILNYSYANGNTSLTEYTIKANLGEWGSTATSLFPFAFSGWNALKKIVYPFGYDSSGGGSSVTKQLKVQPHFIDNCTNLEVLDLRYTDIGMHTVMVVVSGRPRTVSIAPTIQNVNPNLKIIVRDDVYTQLMANSSFSTWHPYLVKVSEWEYVHHSELADYATTTDMSSAISAVEATIPAISAETWTFTLQDGTTVTKQVAVY